jgi:pimeloyl-ACP methyl ester carboxylesterase
MRGYHPTGVPEDGRYQTAALALDALALADALAGDRPASVVGHDWGSGAAYLACIERPERFERVVGLAVPPALGGRFLMSAVQLKRSWYMFFFQMPFAETGVEANDYAFIDQLWRDWSPGYEPDEAFMRRLKDTFAAPGCLQAALGYYRALWNPEHQDPALVEVQGKAGQPVPVPALYMHGADDGCLGAELVDVPRIEERFPAGVEVEMVDGAGHFLHLERPDVVCERIVSFLAG